MYCALPEAYEKICELSPPPTSAIYDSSRMSGQTNWAAYKSFDETSSFNNL